MNGLEQQGRREEGKWKVNQRNEGRKRVSERRPNQSALTFTVVEFSA